MAINIDVHWIDVGSMLTGIGYSLMKSHKNGYKAISIRWGHYIATGVSLFPIFILICSAIASGLLTELANASRIILFISGFYAMLAILDEKNQE